MDSGKGFFIPPNGFIRDNAGNLYVAYQQPSVETLTSTPYYLRASQWKVTTQLAMSSDNGKTWKKVDAEFKSPAKSAVTYTSVYTTPPATRYTEVCDDSNFCVTPVITCTYSRYIDGVGVVGYDSNGYPVLATGKEICHGPTVCPSKKVGTTKVSLGCSSQLVTCSNIECTKDPRFSSCTQKSTTEYTCTTWACLCNPPTKEVATSECANPRKVFKPTNYGGVLEIPKNEYCRKTGLRQFLGANGYYTKNEITCVEYSYCASFGEVIDTPFSYPDNPLGDKEGYKQNGGKSVKCVLDERDMPFTPSVSYYNFQGSIFQSEFQGMAPASDGGIYSYYRLYSIDFSNSLTSGATSKNSSRLYMVKIDQNGKVQNEYAFPNSVSVVAEDSIRFTGQSRGRQYFSENRNLYYSEDGGKTLNPQGYSSYLIRQWTGNWVAPHCEGTAPVTTITLSGTTDDVVDPSPLKYVSVAGGKTVALMKYFPFPLVQQNDGYFINPEMIYDSLPLQYPWLNPIKKYDSVYYDIKYGKAGFWSDWQITYKKSLDQYFQDPFFNKEFFGRFFIQNLNKWVRKYAGSRVDSTSSSSQKTLFTTRSNKVLSSRENDAVSDSQGNLHFLFSAEPYVSGKYSLELYYQFYPAIAFDHTIKTKPSPQVYLISTTNCPSCQTATGWLQQGKITYQPISDMAGITWPESIKTAVNTQLEKTNDGLILVMNADTDYNLIPAGDYIQIASRFGVILDPIRVSVLPDTYYSLDDVDPLTPKIHVTEQGVPIITSNSKELLPQMFQYEYAIGQWKIKKLDLDFTGYSRGLSAVSDLAWYNLPFNSGFISNYVGAKYINFNEYAPYDSTSASQFELPQGDFQSKSLEIPFLVTKGYETVGEFYPDDPRHTQKSITSFTQLHRVNYRVYSSVLTEKLGDEPSADATLSELVPFQKFNLPIPLDSDSTPSLSLSSDLSGGSSSVELTPDEDSGTYSATVTLDARSLWKGGNIDIPRDKITGKVTAKFGKQSVDMPFTVSVKHIQPNHLAYVSPESVTFYASNGKSVKKTLFLTNNYAQSLTFSCGSVFSKAVSGKSIVMVEIAPVDATTACSVTINTYPSGQQLTFERQELVSDTSWAEEDVLAEPAKEQARSLHFTDCANGYCNCGQATAALTDFENSVLSRANAVSSHASDDSISTLYPSGYKETTLLRTGVFDDLDDESLGICAGSLAGWGVDLKPGRVYQLSLNIPQSSGRLFLGSITPDTPKELLKPFSYATQSGIQVNQDTFVRMTEVR